MAGKSSAAGDRLLWFVLAAAGVLVVGLLAAVVFLVVRLNGPAGVTPRRPVTAATMADVFAANPDRDAARQHAAEAEAIFVSLAELVEADGAGDHGKRYLNTSGDVEDVRVVLRTLFLRGWSFSGDYPAFGPLVGDRLQVVGDKATAPLDAALRRRWVEALKGLAAECRAAVEEL